MGRRVLVPARFADLLGGEGAPVGGPLNGPVGVEGGGGRCVGGGCARVPVAVAAGAEVLDGPGAQRDVLAGSVGVAPGTAAGKPIVRGGRQLGPAQPYAARRRRP